MNRDCFAYLEKKELIGSERVPYVSSRCACLTEMVCAMHKCSFYRKKAEWEAENLKLYGTVNVEEQISCYTKGKGAVEND